LLRTRRRLRPGLRRLADHWSAVAQDRRAGPIRLAQLAVLADALQPLLAKLLAIGALPGANGVWRLADGPDLVGGTAVGAAIGAHLSAARSIDRRARRAIGANFAHLLAVFTRLTHFAGVLTILASLTLFASFLAFGTSLCTVCSIRALGDGRGSRHRGNEEGQNKFTHDR
jgi:hypothetical protein